MRRTQIYLDEEQVARLGQRAHSSGQSKSALIREAIDRYLAERPTKEERLRAFREAADAAFGIAPYLPPGHEYVEQIRSIRSTRGEEIRRKWIDRDDDPEPSV